MKKTSPPVVIKWRRARHTNHHVGSWKIAYADFMTTMMAFFLVMWLLGATTPQQREQIAEYFRMPLREAINHNRKFNVSDFPLPANPSEARTTRLRQRQLDHQQDIQRLNNARLRLDHMLRNDPRLKELQPNMRITLMHEGLRIEIIDSKKRPMFATGGTEIAPYMRSIMHIIAPVINDLPNRISLAGHTDNQPYLNGERGYGNWELSADRANASRRELVEGGLISDKILRVIGMANTMAPPGKEDDNAAQRRISIVILTHEQEEAISQENTDSHSEVIDGDKDAAVQLRHLTKPPLDKKTSPLAPFTPTAPEVSITAQSDAALPSLNDRIDGDGVPPAPSIPKSAL
ncbi:flagellar motor protein MotB [Sodalis-like endosymbiont of Proechinophthirus fluctus]|uniref:flagellar motor protein MotB n=1 Tax=Sodalis-like endosymbiont of Proechinophthirus fluctus TaxID=1462730 RepID=UPI0007A85D10|nr:flagellar motor protein MotB [Sodalis-like endosymbiont of Proechinophthirus fluctus]KYP97225.1 flagellar motor protein MotB [Sodalis-like endosymbiont of Proechinophthirus fluctus]